MYLDIPLQSKLSASKGKFEENVRLAKEEARHFSSKLKEMADRMEADVQKQIDAIARTRRDENEALTVEIVCAGPRALKIFEMMSTLATEGEFPHYQLR